MASNDPDFAGAAPLVGRRSVRLRMSYQRYSLRSESTGQPLQQLFTGRSFACLFLLAGCIAPTFAQSISSGTVIGTVTDQSGGVLNGATIDIRNAITGYQQATTTDAAGFFRFNNVPFNNYHLAAARTGLNTATRDIAVRSTVPVTLKLALSVAGMSESVTRESGCGAAEAFVHLAVCPAWVDLTGVERQLTPPGRFAHMLGSWFSRPSMPLSEHRVWRRCRRYRRPLGCRPARNGASPACRAGGCRIERP